jgi:hypothetical protein
VAVLALAAGLAVAVPRWLPQPPPPWETYRERMVEDPDRSRQEGRQVFVYRYPPNEPDRWIRGVRAADLARDTFRQVVGQAVELLRPADAARVLLAAAAAHPDRAEDWQPGVAAVSGRLSPSLPEERDLRARLQALGAPAP